MKDNGFLIYDEAFLSVLGIKPLLEVILRDRSIPFAHEACVFWPEQNALFITSNIFSDKSDEKKIQISRVDICDDGTYECKRIPNGIPGVPMANGGVNYLNGILFCAQGTRHQESGLVHMLPYPPYEVRTMVSKFHGRPFNSPNDVVVHSDGSIWFTDPIYGYDAGFRPAPQLPSQIYRFDPLSGDIRVVADGFKRPNGICFSPDEKTCYITDTDYIHGDGGTNPTRASTMSVSIVPMFRRLANVDVATHIQYRLTQIAPS